MLFCHLSFHQRFYRVLHVQTVTMGKSTIDRPAYLTSDDAKYSLGVHRGPMLPKELNESSALEQVESARGLSLQTQKRTRKEKLARHWKRFWCIYLFANIIFLTIFLPVL
jgi:hypothetical protein